MHSTDSLPVVIGSDTNNATNIDPTEAPAHKQEKFERLRAYNRGWNGPRREPKDAIYEQDNLHRYDAIASKLALTPFQQKRGRYLLEELDLSTITGYGVTVDVVIFALCVLVANEYADQTRYYPPHHTDERFASIADDLELGDCSSQVKMVERLRRKVDL